MVEAATACAAKIKPGEREHLGRREIEGMQREPEIGVLDEREETARAVARPFHSNGILASPDLRLHQAGAVSEDADDASAVVSG
jgi:hypothetical protein